MNLWGRLRKVEARLAAAEAKAREMTSLANLSRREIIEAVCAAVPPESVPVLEEIDRQNWDCSTRFGIGYEHDFFALFDSLQGGWGLLPRVLPHAILVAWRDSYPHYTSAEPPLPLVRCMACGMVMPVPAPGKSQPTRFEACPVCGSRALANRDPTRRRGASWILGETRYVFRDGCIYRHRDAPMPPVEAKPPPQPSPAGAG